MNAVAKVVLKSRLLTIQLCSYFEFHNMEPQALYYLPCYDILTHTFELPYFFKCTGNSCVRIAAKADAFRIRVALGVGKK